MGMTHKPTPPHEPPCRFRDFFKRLFRKKTHPDRRPIYERSFNRFPMEFQLTVDLVNQSGESVQDRAELQDLSGSGAFFVSAVPHQYHEGQPVFLTIYLAGTHDVRARIRVEGAVVRIQPHPRLSTSRGPDGASGIAVKFNETFAFERMDAKPAGDQI